MGFAVSAVASLFLSLQANAAVKGYQIQTKLSYRDSKQKAVTASSNIVVTKDTKEWVTLATTTNGIVLLGHPARIYSDAIEMEYMLIDPHRKDLGISSPRITARFQQEATVSQESVEKNLTITVLAKKVLE